MKNDEKGKIPVYMPFNRYIAALPICIVSNSRVRELAWIYNINEAEYIEYITYTLYMMKNSFKSKIILRAIQNMIIWKRTT